MYYSTALYCSSIIINFFDFLFYFILFSDAFRNPPIVLKRLTFCNVIFFLFLIFCFSEHKNIVDDMIEEFIYRVNAVDIYTLVFSI